MMIISGSDISMSSTYFRREKYANTGELKMWTGENPSPSQEHSRPARDTVTITEDAKNELETKYEPQELHGPVTGKGFHEPAPYDEKSNDWVGEKDSVFSTLKIRTKAAEGNDLLKVLEAVNVGVIYLAHADSEFTLNNVNTLKGQVATGTGLYTNDHGTVQTAQQVHLVV